MFRKPDQKRTFDLVLSVFMLIICSPVFLIIGVLIKVLMPGPVFFLQKRIGKDYKPFTLYKFRTMEVISRFESERFDLGDRSRITKLGSLLRKTKFDEIPQLFNILKGDMSFVGPRPEIQKWTEVYTDKWKIVHSVRPGITDPASIEFLREEEILSASPEPEKTYREVILPRKLDLNIAYTKQRSMKGDMQILLKTAKEMIIR